MAQVEKNKKFGVLNILYVISRKENYVKTCFNENINYLLHLNEYFQL